MSHNTWRELAEKASEEQDPEKLMALVKKLNEILSQPAKRRTRTPDLAAAATQS